MKILQFLHMRVIFVLALITLLAAFTGIPATNAAFPGANGKIVFAGTVGGTEQIFVMNPDGTNRIQLTNSLIGNSYPSWSADGTKIAFTSSRDGDSEIYWMYADGSNQTRLTNVPGGDAIPHWSPDGTKIAFYSDRDGDAEIFVMDAGGNNQIPLTNNTDYDVGPAWSPDGTKIAFDHNHDIYVMNSDGSNQTPLTNSPGDNDFPNWSPDGTKITFTSTRVSEGWYDIYVMDADGDNQTRLTDNPSFDTQPAWSPDGAKIAFLTGGRNGNSGIYVMNADGSNETYITTNGVNPNWQPIQPISVAIDIKPGSDPNCFNSDGHGVIPVAIFSTADFDATGIDPASVTMDGQGVKVAGKNDKSLSHTEDVNTDGYVDLVVQIEDTDGTYQVGETTAMLSGKTYFDQAFQGTDFICIVP